MSEEQWRVVDQYVSDLLIPADPVLDEALRKSDEAGLPKINVSPPQGKFLMLLAKLRQSRRILEIGTLGGYSTIWLARALSPGGNLISLESEPLHAEVARANIAHAGFADVVEVRLGPAAESLEALVAENVPKFDFIFIDADKQNYPTYFEWSLKLSRSGTVMVADNVVRQGAVADSDSADERVAGVRKFNELVAADARVDATIIQTVGSKGYDGFTLATVGSI